jgi:uncharacterized protein (DUF1501 family)
MGEDTMQPTRRDLLRLGLGPAALLACGSSVPEFLARSARAVAAGGADTSRGRVLVVLELTGGNDGLNTVVPYRDDEYRKHRRRIGVPAGSVLKIDDRIGLHPALRGLADLLEGHQLAVVQGVGYPNPSRSHFKSMAVWQTARPGAGPETPGWLNRCLGRQRRGPGGDPPGLHVGDAELPQALAGREADVPCLPDREQIRRRLGVPEGRGAKEQRAALDAVSGEARDGASSQLQFMRRSALATFARGARLEEVLRAGPAAAGNYPDFGLAERLRLIAQLIRAGLTTPIYYARLDGFDTHVNQVGTHPALLREVGGSLKAFFDELNKAGEGKRVLLLVFSEFGRRPAENASGGTDHGTAAPVFLAGPAVRPGPHGPYPNLRDLEDGDPRHAIDFRQVYATVLDGWLKCPSAKVLGGDFGRLPLLKTDQGARP